MSFVDLLPRPAVLTQEPALQIEREMVASLRYQAPIGTFHDLSPETPTTFHCFLPHKSTQTPH